jgi:hypothetical protein
VIPLSEDLTAISFKRKAKWAKVQKVVLHQRSAPASASRVIEASGPAFWVLVLLLFVFVFVGLRMCVTFSL